MFKLTDFGFLVRTGTGDVGVPLIYHFRPLLDQIGVILPTEPVEERTMACAHLDRL
jgi:hypothetical protein